MAVCLLYDILDSASIILDTYEAQFTKGTDADDNDVSYDDFNYKWILKNCGTQLDSIISDLTLIAYIYNLRIDIPALVTSLLTK